MPVGPLEGHSLLKESKHNVLNELGCWLKQPWEQYVMWLELFSVSRILGTTR